MRKDEREKNDWFKIKRTLRQGCGMSPCLFNIYIDGVLKTGKSDRIDIERIDENGIVKRE